jgi:hypothetical protein
VPPLWPTSPVIGHGTFFDAADKACGLFFDCPRRREAASCHLRICSKAVGGFNRRLCLVAHTLRVARSKCTRQRWVSDQHRGRDPKVRLRQAYALSVPSVFPDYSAMFAAIRRATFFRLSAGDLGYRWSSLFGSGLSCDLAGGLDSGEAWPGVSVGSEDFVGGLFCGRA